MSICQCVLTKSKSNRGEADRMCHSIWSILSTTLYWKWSVIRLILIQVFSANAYTIAAMCNTLPIKANLLHKVLKLLFASWILVEIALNKNQKQNNENLDGIYKVIISRCGASKQEHFLIRTSIVCVLHRRLPLFIFPLILWIIIYCRQSVDRKFSYSCCP